MQVVHAVYMNKVKHDKAIVYNTSPALCTPVTPFPPIGDVAYHQRPGGGPSRGRFFVQQAQKMAKIARVVPEISSRTDRQTDRRTGWFLRPDCVPSSECPQFGMSPSFDRCTECTPPRRRFNQNIPPSVVLLQLCHCRNRHRGKLQNLSPPSVLFESSRIFFTIHRRRKRKNTMDQKFEIRIL